MKTVKKIARAMLDLLLPTRCQSCGTMLRQAPLACFCAACWGKIRPIEAPHCARCGKPFSSQFHRDQGAAARCYFCKKKEPPFALAREAVVYEGTLKKAVQLFKFRGKSTLARPLGRFLAAALTSEPAYSACDLVVPVPVKRPWWRPRDPHPAALLAQDVAAHLKKPLEKRSLVKIKDIPPQRGLKRKERLKNVRGAFGVRDAATLAGKTVLLVDDLFTTGATAGECALALKQGGAKEVYVLALARGV